MPSTEFYYLSDTDIGNILAYIRSVKPMDNKMPVSKLLVTGRIVMSVTKEITFLLMF